MGNDQLSPEEIAAEEAAELPNREAMSLLDPGLVGGGLIGGTDPLPPSDTGDDAPGGSLPPQQGDAPHPLPVDKLPVERYPVEDYPVETQ
jgi:hypothetical protein